MALDRYKEAHIQWALSRGTYGRVFTYQDATVFIIDHRHFFDLFWEDVHDCAVGWDDQGWIRCQVEVYQLADPLWVKLDVTSLDLVG